MAKKTCSMVARSDWGVGQVQNRGLAHTLSRGQSPVGFHGPRTGGWLVFLNGAHRGEDMRVPIGESKLGSAWVCDLILTGVGIGSQHAILRVGMGEASVIPAAGNREVKVNNRLITGSTEILDGTLISVGDLHAIFRFAMPYAPGYQAQVPVSPVGMPNQGALARVTRGWLVIGRGAYMGQDFRLVNGRNRIGSSEGLELTLSDPHLQKVAMALECQVSSCVISFIANGVNVKVGGEIAKQGRTLVDSDVIQLDHVEAYLKWL